VWVVSSVGEVLPNFFKINEVNYVIIHINLCRCVERNLQHVISRQLQRGGRNLRC